jgi:fructose-1,6-bisphosphatase II
MTQLAGIEAEAGTPTSAAGPCLCESYARVTERSALASARWLGRADQSGAEEAAYAGMKEALEQLPIDGHIVIGGVAEEHQLAAGQRIGTGGEASDLALGALEGIGIVARGKIDLKRPVAENIEALAAAFGRRVGDVTTIVLDRPRHHDLIEEIRAAGARIKLIQDGDVTASISAAIRGTNDHLAIGIGGTRQAVLTAAALRCLGGEMQAQLWPTTRGEIELAAEQGITDMEQVFSIDDLAPTEVIVAATGVSNGDLLRGVRYGADSARTHSLVMCTRCNWVRFVDGTHFFARERREEVRLL